jgi:hypothetical protein
MEEGWAPGGGGEAGVWRRCGGGAATEIQREGGGKEEERKVGFGWDRARWSEGGDAWRGGAEAIRWWESFVCRAGAEGVGSGATGGWAEPRAGEAMRAGFLRTKFVLLFILFSSRYIYITYSEVRASESILASSDVDEHHDPVAATCSAGCLS